jgi:hypothetical protein
MKKNIITNIVNEILNTKRVSLKQLFNIPFDKKALSLGELFVKTNKKSIKYSKGCTAVLDRAMPKVGRWNFSVSCTEKWSKGPYVVRIRLLKTKGKKTKGFLGREVEISCNCNAWRYNGADYNAKSDDYSERQYSDGSAPDVRDPKRKYLICKHVAACVPILKNFLIPKSF